MVCQRPNKSYNRAEIWSVKKCPVFVFALSLSLCRHITRGNIPHAILSYVICKSIGTWFGTSKNCLSCRHCLLRRQRSCSQNISTKWGWLNRFTFTQLVRMFEEEVRKNMWQTMSKHVITKKLVPNYWLPLEHLSGQCTTASLIRWTPWSETIGYT